MLKLRQGCFVHVKSDSHGKKLQKTEDIREHSVLETILVGAKSPHTHTHIHQNKIKKGKRIV